MKTLKKLNSHDIEILDSDGNVHDLYYGPDKGRNIVQTFYWYNDLQGRLKQELRPPGYYHGKPRIYVKEDIEKTDENRMTSHLKVYYDKELLAEMSKTMPEYISSFIGYHNDEDLRFQIRTTINYLINESGWKTCQVGKKYRKQKKSTPRTKKSKKPIKPIKRPKPKKVVRIKKANYKR
jgi:hypothetical protein